MNAFLERLALYAERTRLTLASARNTPLLALLGVVTGLVAGVVVIVFRVFIEICQRVWLPDGNPENYEALPWDERAIAAVAGGVLLALMFRLAARPAPRVGVIHVIERLLHHEGLLPLRNALMQFFGGMISIIAGHSVGREGPSVHLGAAGGSLMGRWLRVPNNSIRTLVACGSAAAIAASFNTPLAGVIFAMEVVLMEYTIVGFTPVILSAVSATALNRLLFDAHPAFDVPTLHLVSLWELPGIVIMGVAIGTLSAAFIVAMRRVIVRTRDWPVWLQLSLAGLCVAGAGVVCPEVMGIGYDTVDTALLGGLTLSAAVWILAVKFGATALGLGLRLPGGLIGPSLFMGALAGCATGLGLEQLSFTVSPPGFYAMLGMGAMMGATLQAPLAALMALVELTANQNIILPGMLAVVSASMASRELFDQGSVFIAQIRALGVDYRNDTGAPWLRRLAVGSVMNTAFRRVAPQIPRVQAERLIEEDKPHWLFVSRPEGNVLLPAADLARHLEEGRAEAETVDLMEIPSRRLELAPIPLEATLQQALAKLNESDAEALYVVRPLGPSADRIYGIVTRAEIERGYSMRDEQGLY